MKRSDINKEIVRYLAKGGTITKLPDGPNWNFQPYGVRVKPTSAVDLTAMEDPGSKKQIEILESSKV